MSNIAPPDYSLCILLTIIILFNEISTLWESDKNVALAMGLDASGNSYLEFAIGKKG